MVAYALDVTPRQALQELEAGLGMTDEELAQALNANRRTLQRWRAGSAYPQQAARIRLADLLRLDQRLQETFSSAEARTHWFRSPSRYLGGITPIEAVRVGRVDRVESALEALDSGVFI